MITLEQYDALEAAAMLAATTPDSDWDDGHPRYFVLRDGHAVMADPLKKEIKGGEVFVTFYKYDLGDDKVAVNPAMAESRAVNVMAEDQESAEAHFIIGDYLAKESVCILGYHLHAGQEIVLDGDSRYSILMFASVLGLQQDTYVNQIQPAVLQNLQTKEVVVAGIGGWLRDIGVRAVSGCQAS